MTKADSGEHEKTPLLFPNLFPSREKGKTMKLNALKVEAIKATQVRQEIPDSLCVGLYLTVQPTGKKGWQVRYRAGGVHRRMTLGYHPAMTLAEARDLAREKLALAQQGRDPVGEAAAEKAAKLADDLSDRDRISTLLGQYDKRHLSTLKSGKAARRFLDRFMVPAWGQRKVQTVTRRDVIDLLDGIVDSDRGVTANRVLAHIRGFLNWCRERDIIQVCPTDKMKAPVNEVSRERVLTDQEVRWLWRACEKVGEPWGDMGKLLLLTGQRLNEVAQMTQAEVSGAIWRMDSSRTKNSRAHDVPLSAAALAVVQGRVAGKKGHLFTTTGTTPVSGFNKGRDHLAKAMEAVANEGGDGAVTIPQWGFHDLRRTAATGMERLGVAVQVTEAALNHVSGSKAGIVGVYQRHNFADEKRAALEAWGQFVLSLVGEQPDNVVRLEGRG